MKEIGIYRRVFPLVSETFITEQAHNMMRYQPTVIANTILHKIPFQNVALNQNDFLKFRQIAFLLSRFPELFDLDTLNKLSLIHAHFGTDGVYSMTLAEKLKVPLIVTFHGYDITIFRTRVWKTGKLLYYQLLWHEEELKRKATAFIAVSNFIRNQLLEKGYPEEKIIQHYIGVDTAKFSPSEREANTRYILCVGRHTGKKGIDILLRAFARIANKYPDVTLIQVGTGATSAELHALAKVLGISSRVNFLGALPHEKVINLMRDAEIFALPSQTAKNGDSEALGIVFNEASACGVPIVSTQHGGISEAVLDGETGFLVPERDDVALAEKLDILLSDRLLAKKMGQRGREFVCENFDIRKQTAKLEAIYDLFTN